MLINFGLEGKPIGAFAFILDILDKKPFIYKREIKN